MNVLPIPRSLDGPAGFDCFAQQARSNSAPRTHINHHAPVLLLEESSIVLGDLCNDAWLADALRPSEAWGGANNASTGVSSTAAPSEPNTSSKARLNFASRSRSRKAQPSSPLLQCQQQ